ncbi:unnamed protein product [Knipowitschia caucasica]
MVWNRPYIQKRSFHTRKRVSCRKLVKLKFWLWRKRQERSRARCRVLKSFKNSYCSHPMIFLETNGNSRRTKPEKETPDLATAQASDIVEKEAPETNVEMFRESGMDLDHSDAPAVSSHGDLSDATEDFRRGLSKYSHSDLGENREHLHKAELEQTAFDVVVKENKVISLEIESPRMMSKIIQEFLTNFHQKYGSFIPLRTSDLLKHIKEKFHEDIKDYKVWILETTVEEMAKIKSNPTFKVKYKKHTLTLDDLSTLASESWINDQVINMYGDLIMDCGNSKVHFLNSFFHKKLLSRGYEGVKRWTKQVDLFSQHLILVPVHIEVHWCLVAADIIRKKVCLYDSQRIGLQKVAWNILKYLMKEAKEKKQTAFEDGWTVSMMEKIPQQTNENDCGVFILEYSRCLALSEALQFSQRDIPFIRKRIYKELCECKLHDKQQNNL